MNEKADTLFFTACTESYDFFAVPYAYFCLRNNPAAKVEIVFDDYEAFMKKNVASVQKILEMYPDSVLFRQASVTRNKKIVPGSIRFVEEPQTRCTYLYIGDIDLLVMDDVQKIHLQLMERHSLPFSNIVRLDKDGKPTKRLSGLHFIRFNEFYPLPDISDLDLGKENDEMVLFEIMNRKGLMVPLEFRSRPECGVHVSLSRDPAGRSTGRSMGVFSKRPTLGWGGRQYFSKFLRQIRESRFGALAPHLQIEMKFLLVVLEGLCSDRLRSLHRMSLNYCVDKRLMVGDSEKTRAEVLSAEVPVVEADSLQIKRKRRDSLIIWPDNPDVLMRHAEDRAGIGEFIEAVELLLHLSDLERGVSVIRKSGIVEKYHREILEVGKTGANLIRALLDPSAPTLLVVGLQRSGTNFVTEIVRNSLDGVRIIDTGSREFFWKHALPQESGANVSRGFQSPEHAIESVSNLHVVVVSKHPLSWIASISVRDSADLRYQRPNLFDEADAIDAEAAVSFYARFHEEWRSVKQSNRITFVRYEDALFDATAMCGKIARSIGVPSPSEAFVPKTVPYSKGDYASRETLYKQPGIGLSKSIREQAEIHIQALGTRLAFLDR